MIKKGRFPRIYFGWWTVLTGGFLAMWGLGYHSSGISALFKPIASELGFSRAQTAVADSIGRFEGGVGAPLVGGLTDRFGPRWIVFIGVFLMGLGLTLMNFIDSLWAFYIVWGVIVGAGVTIGLTGPVHTAIANWFVKKRGLASGIQWAATGLGGVLVMPLIAWLITIQGWRMTCAIGGLVMWLAGLPLVWFCFKQHRPEYYGLLPDGATVEEVADTSQMVERGVEYAAEVEEAEFTLRQAIRTPTYWLLILASGSHFVAITAMSLHSIPFLTDIGIDPLKAASILAMVYLSGIPARLVAGFLADRVKKQHLRFLIGGTYLLQTAGFAVFLLNPTITMIYVWYVLYGIGYGAGMALGSPMRARYFGRKAFGSIGGLSSVFMTPFTAIAPMYLGWVYDTTGSYINAFTVVTKVLVFCSVLSVFTLPPKPPAEISDVRRFL